MTDVSVTQLGQTEQPLLLKIPAKQRPVRAEYRSPRSEATAHSSRSDAGTEMTDEPDSSSTAATAASPEFETDKLVDLSSSLNNKSKSGSGPFTMSADWMTNKAMFDATLRSVFARGWNYAGHLSLLYPTGRVTGNVQDGVYRQSRLGPHDYFVLRCDGEWKAFRGTAPGRISGIVEQTEIMRDDGASIRGEECGILNAEQIAEARAFTEVSLHITVPSDLIFVRFDPAGPSFIEFFGDLEDTLRDYDFESCSLYSTWRSVGNFNWQTWVDGYQECYHFECALTHPSLNKDYAIAKYKVEPIAGAAYCRHSCPRKNEAEIDGVCVTKDRSGWGNARGLWLFAFPGLALNCFSLGFYTITVIPLGPNRTMLQREIFVRNKPTRTAGIPTQDEIDVFLAFMKQVGDEDYELCELTQKNLDTGIYSRGQLHPNAEAGVVWYQGLVREMTAKWLVDVNLRA